MNFWGSPDTLRTYGAVCRETVIEMARSMCTALGADLSVSVSGVEEQRLAGKFGLLWQAYKQKTRRWL